MNSGYRSSTNFLKVICENGLCSIDFSHYNADLAMCCERLKNDRSFVVEDMKEQYFGIYFQFLMSFFILLLQL